MRHERKLDLDRERDGNERVDCRLRALEIRIEKGPIPDERLFELLGAIESGVWSEPVHPSPRLSLDQSAMARRLAARAIVARGEPIEREGVLWHAAGDPPALFTRLPL